MEKYIKKGVVSQKKRASNALIDSKICKQIDKEDKK
jgi:hypothetical protein